MKSMGVALLLLLLIGVQTGCLAIEGGYVGNDRFKPVFLTPERATYAKFPYQAWEKNLSGLTPSEKARLAEPTIPKAISKEDLVKTWCPPSLRWSMKSKVVRPAPSSSCMGEQGVALVRTLFLTLL